VVLLRHSGFFIKWGNRYTYVGPFDIRIGLWDKQPSARTSGICSRCFDHQHALFFDYDHKIREFVMEDLTILANGWLNAPGIMPYLLGRIYVFQTGRTNFMAICPDKYHVATAHAIMRRSSCDFAFKSGARRISETATWVLRTTPKGSRTPPRYIGHVDNEFTLGRRLKSFGNIKSLAHMLYMHQHMGVPYKDIIWEPNDGCKDITSVSYNTATRLDGDV